MLKFGKKINYRPLSIAFLIAFFPLFATSDIFDSTSLGITVGVVVFLGVLFIYYFPNVPLEFTYWETSGKIIRYADMNNWKNRILGIFLPSATHLTTIDVSDVQSISLIGDFNSQYKSPMAIPFTLQNGILYPALSMISHPNSVRLHLKNGHEIDLDIARDYAYSKNMTIQKLQRFFKILDNVSIHVIDSKGNQILPNNFKML